ncbi:putative COA8 family protein [Dirofilaria immitis]
MFDYGTPEDCSNKRLEKALERTVKFSRELLRCDSFEGSAALIALCGGHSPSHHERCASAIGSIPKGCGFVLDIMQFAKRLRVLPKKLKVKKMSKVGTIEKALQLESFPDASGNIGSLDLVITESEFDKNVIKDLLAGVWPHISPSHLRLVNGAFSPTEVVALAHLGVDLFDSSYAIFLAEQGKAFVCSANFPHEATFNVFDFTDTLYSEDFRPLCKNCSCYTCSYYTRSYLQHLTNTMELLSPVLLVIHNIQEYERMFALLRENLSKIFMHQKQQVEKNNLGEKSIRDLRLDKRFDWVGPPDDISKIRPVRLRRLTNETKQERKYREAREALNQWSSQFWARHNILFEKKKAEFVDQKRKSLGRLEHSSAVDMSEFYKKFLDEQYNSLTNYNREWYYRNIRLFWPAFKVQVIRFRRTLYKFFRK